MNMEDLRISTEDADLAVSQADNEVLLELISDDNNMEMYLSREQVKALIKQLTDLL